MAITDDIIDGFNDILRDTGIGLRIKRSEQHISAVDIVLEEEEFLDSYILNPSKNFYNLLELFFKNKCGIENLEYNNAGTTFWVWAITVMHKYRWFVSS